MAATKAFNADMFMVFFTFKTFAFIAFFSKCNGLDNVHGLKDMLYQPTYQKRIFKNVSSKTYFQKPDFCQA